MPRGTTPLPTHSGQFIPNWARIARRMNSLLFGSRSRNSARSFSTLNATISDFWVFCSLRAMVTPGRGRVSPHGIFGPCRPQGGLGRPARRLLPLAGLEPDLGDRVVLVGGELEPRLAG